jgi:putative ABC transport system permease protein
VLFFGILAALGGILIGSGIVISLKRVLASLLFGITALDPSVYLASGVALILLAFLASLIPAARLLGLNVQQILRQ